MVYQANLELNERLIAFYFHMNSVGTFFSILSFYQNTKVSEINTLVRLGNGYPGGQIGKFTPADITPFTITLTNTDGISVTVINDEKGLSTNLGSLGV